MAALLLAGVGILAARAQPAPSAGSAKPLPDLSVAYISLTPRYPAYEVEYPDDLPQPIHPETGKPLTQDEADKIQRWPRTNEAMTAVARVVNHGPGAAGAFTYAWLLDGKRVAGGRLPGLSAACEATPASVPWRLTGVTVQEAPLRDGSFVDVPFSFRWPKKGRRLEFQVRVESGQELTEENNSRLEQTDAWGIAVVIHRRAYNAWAKLRTPGHGSGFEDWVQDHLQALRSKFDQSAYPSAPGGVLPQLRLDTVRVLDDAEDLNSVLERRAVNGWDCAWAYPDRRSPELDARRTDWTVLKAWGRQLGLIDLTGLTVDPDRSEARDPETKRPVEQGYLFTGTDPMGIPDDEPFSEHSVLSLNTQASKRRGYDGAQLYAIPRFCQVRVLDNNNRPVPDASISVYQADAGRLLSSVVAQGSTDTNGNFGLPNRPVPTIHTESGYTLQNNPFGAIHRNGDNGLLLLRISERGQVDYQWLTVMDCNVAYWHGQTSRATFDLHTHLPANRMALPPGGLKARIFNAQQFRSILLDWTAVADKELAGYFIYRAAYPTYQFEKIGATSALRNNFVDPLDADTIPGERVRYAVTAVDQHGNESGLSGPFTLSLEGEAP